MSGIGVIELVIILAVLLFVLLIAGLIAAVVWFARRTSAASHAVSAQSAQGAQEQALDVLRRRYAAGELTREEFLAMQQDLTQ